MNYELSDKLKSAIEEEIARLACLSDISKEVALGDDFCFTPTQGMYAGHRVNAFSLSEEGSTSTATTFGGKRSGGLQ